MALTPAQLRQLAACPLFSAVERADLERWAGRARLAYRSYHAGAMVAFRGDAYEDLMVLFSGRLAAQMSDFQGRQLTVETLRGPTIVASAILFAEQNALPVQLVAETDIRLIEVPARAVLQLCHDSPPFLRGYLRDTGERLVFLADKIRFLQLHTLKQKLSAYLLDLSRRQASLIVSVPYNVERLAELFGVARPSLSRVLAELVAAGAVVREGRDYHILDESGLQALLAE